MLKNQNMVEIYEIDSLNGMEEFAKSLKSKLVFPCLLLLKGTLGAGKTTFTKYFAQELGIEDFVLSPTYLFMKEYKTLDNKYLLHLDLYRFHDEKKDLESEREYLIEEIDKNDYITIIEWPLDDLSGLFYKSKQVINIDIDVISLDKRKVRLSIT